MIPEPPNGSPLENLGAMIEPMSHLSETPPKTEDWRDRLHEVIFETDTPAGKGFDVALLLLITVSILVVILETVAPVRAAYGPLLRTIEWVVTLLFTLEYILRLLSVRRPIRYARSFFGVVDLLSILPTFLSLVIDGTQSLLVLRALRLLRVFRVLKLGHFVIEARQLIYALQASARKIIVFMGTVLTLVLIIGAFMYLIEGQEHGFTSIPLGMYWAIVTLTTVGYGDIAPSTVLGKVFASAVMMLGYAIIAVPTGIVSVELAKVHQSVDDTLSCPSCSFGEHASDAVFCKRCGEKL